MSNSSQRCWFQSYHLQWQGRQASNLSDKVLSLCLLFNGAASWGTIKTEKGITVWSKVCIDMVATCKWILGVWKRTEKFAQYVWPLNKAVSKVLRYEGVLCTFIKEDVSFSTDGTCWYSSNGSLQETGTMSWRKMSSHCCICWYLRTACGGGRWRCWVDMEVAAYYCTWWLLFVTEIVCSG